MSQIPSTALQVMSTVTADSRVELAIHEVPVPVPGPDEVLVRIEAAPINPSDLGMLFAGADLAKLVGDSTGNGGGVTVTPGAHGPVASVDLGPGAFRAVAARVGVPTPVGNEGGGVVVAAGDSPEAQALIGRTVGALGGGMYTQYRCLPASAVLALPEGVTPAQGAACFVNPLTVLGMVGTMRAEGHTALVHTAAASNLGQMLNRVCLADGIGLVNIVRRPEQAELLRSQGAHYVCDSSSSTFEADLTAALQATGATIGFDATGGGLLASHILVCMEAAILANSSGYQRYGSSVHKQVYLYGGLDRSPTVIDRRFGMAWGVGGWLLTPFLINAGAEEAARLRARVAAEITTTFASAYTDQVSLAGMLTAEAIGVYGRQATGQKYLVTPQA
jgi:NADPH:quinone reductase